MRKFFCVMLATTLTLSTNAWSATSHANTNNAGIQKAKKCLFPKSRKRAPGWICSTQKENLTLAAVGSFHKSGAGREYMEQMATADARAKLVQQLNVPVQKKIVITNTAANNTAGLPDSKLISKISEDNLQGTRVLKKVLGPKGRLYVLIGFDEEGTRKLQDAIIAAYQVQKQK